jgi:hypothetical protein
MLRLTDLLVHFSYSRLPSDQEFEVDILYEYLEDRDNNDKAGSSIHTHWNDILGENVLRLFYFHILTIEFHA